ncbi:MAG: PKD domain-containing protein [Pyrinomonadaceae bacterium]
MPEPVLNPPVSQFIADVQVGDAPLTVEFTNQSTGMIAGFAWSFGDGSVSKDESPEHIYEAPGNYLASLTVFNEAGSSVTTYRIDVTAPATDLTPTREETPQDLLPSIRAAMRRPSEQKLRYRDILDKLTDILRGYSRDLNVSERDHRTDESQCVLNRIDGNDYILTVNGVREVEPMVLKYLPQAELQASHDRQVWREISIVPLEYYSARAIRDYAVCSFFGGMILDDGVKVKISLAHESVRDAVWIVRHRIPILKLIALNARTPLPPDFLPMLKIEAVMACLPLVRDDSDEWYKWRKVNEPIFIGQIADWRDRWRDFLDMSVEPKHIRKIAANDYRRKQYGRPGYSVVPGVDPNNT